MLRTILHCSSGRSPRRCRRLRTHAPITRSRPSSTRALEGEVKGEVTRVWWQNPHIRYDVAMKMPDGSTEMLGAAAARQPADVSARELDRADDPGRLSGHGHGQLGPRQHEEAVRDLHQRRHRARERPPARPLRELGHRRRRRPPTRTSTTRSAPTTTRSTSRGYWDNRYKFQVTVDDFQPKPMPMTPATAKRSTRPHVRRRSRAALLAAGVAAHLRLAVSDADRRRRLRTT